MLGLAGQGLAESLLLERAVMAQVVSRVSLKLRKEPKYLDVILTGIGGSARVVQEQSNSTSWRGEIQRSGKGLSKKEVAQQVARPELGLASVRLRGSGSTFELEVTSVAGTVLQKPKILATGDDLVLRFRGLTGAASTRQFGSFDLRRPGRIPQSVSAPPLRSRAVAPPLGDMAVGSMLIGNRSFVQVSGPPVTLTLNNAPAKDALMSLARLGNYGFVYVGSSEQAGRQRQSPSSGSADAGVTMSFRGESYAKALNSVLMASGLQGKLDGRTLLVGESVSSKTFGPQMSKVFRLNQVDAASALDYLGKLGAKVTVAKTTTVTATSTELLASDEEEDSEAGTASASGSTIVESYGAEVGPLVGLVGTADERLNTLVLVGDPKLISVAEAYLKQLDLRKRQVAVKMQILNVTLDNDSSIDSSFSAKFGNAFIVSQSGKAHMNFGAYKPGSADGGTGVYSGNGYQAPGTYDRDINLVEKTKFFPPYIEAKQTLQTGTDENGNPIFTEVPLYDSEGRPFYWPEPDPLAPWVERSLIDPKTGQKIQVKDNVNLEGNQYMQYPDSSFYSYIESVVISSSAKTLAQPTLLVQEGESASVRSGETVITGVSKNEGANGSVQFSNTREDAGLTVNLKVEKIDDNGFVTLRLDPSVSVPVSAGQQEGVQIFNLVTRELNSGRIRLRDQQTLIITGVIQESDRQLATKWPLLGDLPLIGQLFRNSSSTRSKNELVIIVTPAILDDDNGGAYGYGYSPGTEEVTRLIGSGSTP